MQTPNAEPGLVGLAMRHLRMGRPEPPPILVAAIATQRRLGREWEHGRMSDWSDIFGRPMIFDKAGQPITSDEWGRLRFDAETRKISDYARIALDEFGNGVSVSTVWLGMDHQFEDGPPLIFETMVFGGPLADHQWRYATEAEAIAGHEQVVAKVRDLLRLIDGSVS